MFLGRHLMHKVEILTTNQRQRIFYDIIDIHLTSHSWMTRGSFEGFTKPGSFGTQLDDPPA